MGAYRTKTGSPTLTDQICSSQFNELIQTVVIRHFLWREYFCETFVILFEYYCP